MTQKEIKHCMEQAEANLAIEDMYPTGQMKAEAEKLLLGEITMEDIIRKMKEEYRNG